MICNLRGSNTCVVLMMIPIVVLDFHVAYTTDSGSGVVTLHKYRHNRLRGS